MRAFVIAACVAAAFTLFSPAVHAEPVVITGGVANVGNDITGFLMTGQDTSISMSVLGSFSPVEIFPGQMVSFTAHATPENFSTLGFPVTVNGVDYGNVSLKGSLTFTTETFTAPPLTPTAQTFSAPGRLSGTLTGFNINDDTSPLFTIDLTGHGVFSSTFHGFSAFDDRWFGGIEPAASIRFDAGNNPNPTPEPASLLLLGTGAAGLAARNRRGRSKQV